MRPNNNKGMYETARFSYGDHGRLDLKVVKDSLWDDLNA